MNEKLVQRLDLQISFEDQKKITEIVKSKNEITVLEFPDSKPFWISDGCRSLVESQYTEELSEQMGGRYTYLNRLNPNSQWNWIEGSIKDIVSKYLKRLERIIPNPTRISVIMQIPGKEVPLHRDLVVGEVYNNMKCSTETTWGKHKLPYRGDPWLEKYVNIVDRGLHRKQAYYGLRIPLTERESDNGFPYLRDHVNNEDIPYDVGRNIFLLNEATVEHGARACDFYRGVVIVDGLLNLEALPTYF